MAGAVLEFTLHDTSINGIHNLHQAHIQTLILAACALAVVCGVVISVVKK